jgi:hypothetical protein
LRNLGIEGILSILKRTERSDINKSSIFNRQYSIPALPGWAFISIAFKIASQKLRYPGIVMEEARGDNE